MNKQAFRNRMQQLKQYREQNPGKTYLDWKTYADGGINIDNEDSRTDHPTESQIYRQNQFVGDTLLIKKILMFPMRNTIETVMEN